MNPFFKNLLTHFHTLSITIIFIKSHQSKRNQIPNSTFVLSRFNKPYSLHESTKDRREREGERRFEHDILELDVAIRREKRAERREMERIQFNYGIDLFWSSKSFFFLALSATCRGDVRQKRASVAYNERGTPFLFLFFPLCLSLSPSFFCISTVSIRGGKVERTRAEKMRTVDRHASQREIAC